MGTRTTTARHTVAGALAAGACAATLATAGLGSAPAANATCFSIFGIGNSANCKSNLLSAAVAIGPNANAVADGLFGAAFSLGDGAFARTGGAFTFGITAGKNSFALGDGLFGIGINVGASGNARAWGANSLLNLAISVPAPGSKTTLVWAGAEDPRDSGVGDIAVLLGGSNITKPLSPPLTIATGNLNTAVNIGGNDSRVLAGKDLVNGGGTGNLTAAFQIGGSNNDVQATPGPFAWAGSIFQTGATVKQQNPGVNINNKLQVGGASSTGHARPAATAVSSGAPQPAASVTRLSDRGHQFHGHLRGTARKP